MALIPSEHALVAEVLMRGPISRAELAQRLDLSAPSLTRLSKPFLNAGAFIEVDAPETDDSVQKGRPRKGYAINGSYGEYIGINLTQTEAHAVQTNLRGEILAKGGATLPSSAVGSVVETLTALIDELCPAPRPRLFGVGISLGGQVKDRSIVTRNPFLKWRDVPLAELVSERVHVPVVVENDVTALAEGAHLFGAARGEPDFAVITIGAGVGYGLVSNDRVVSAADTGLGLGGHIPLDTTGPYCPKGHRGCAEALLSFPGITRQLAAVRQEPVSIDAFMEAIHADDGAATAIFTAAATGLGRLISLVANLTMNVHVVLAGEGLALWEFGADQIQAEVDRYRDPDARPVEIIVDNQRFNSWAVGAAASAIIDSLERLPLPR